MRCRLSRDYRFEAAHFLPRVPDEHKCRRVHGHSYQLTITIAGEVDPAMGWILDFAQIDEVVGPVVAKLDHRLLNDVDGLDNPTCEHLAAYLWQRIAPGLSVAQDIVMSEVVVSETPDSRCVFRGDL